jgi:hypothetical protein
MHAHLVVYAFFFFSGEYSRGKVKEAKRQFAHQVQLRLW